MVKIAPSILSADLLQLENQVKAVEKFGADWIHVDVMDGHFVPNITFGPLMVSALKRVTSLPLDVHLMISDPDKFVPEFAAAGASILTVHQETCIHLHRSVQHIKNNSIKAGVSLNPATDISTIYPILEELDLVLLMSVNPGFGGQKFIPFVLHKIQELAQIKEENGYSFEIEVDGGINSLTAKEVVSAGATVLVAGNSIFGQENIGLAFKNIRESAGSTFES